MAPTDLQGRPRGREGLHAWYAELLEDQASSDLSVAEYAVSLGLAPRTLYQWKRRLSQKPVRVELKREATEGLIQLSLPREPKPTAQPGFVVRLASGRRVEVPDAFDGDALQRLLSVLDRC